MKTSTPQFLAALVNSLCRSAAPVTEDDIVAAYFAHINKWLPIISQKKFRRQRGSDITLPRRPEMDLLLLCMYLLVREPCESSLRLETEKYYKGARCAYYALQAESLGSIELAQCGLMLGTYEHASGLVRQAYGTIWTCASMIYSLRLQDKHLSSMDCDNQEQTECAEAYCLFWAVRIRDRFDTTT